VEVSGTYLALLRRLRDAAPPAGAPW